MASARDIFGFVADVFTSGGYSRSRAINSHEEEIKRQRERLENLEREREVMFDTREGRQSLVTQRQTQRRRRGLPSLASGGGYDQKYRSPVRERYQSLVTQMQNRQQKEMQERREIERIGKEIFPRQRQGHGMGGGGIGYTGSPGLRRIVG